MSLKTHATHTTITTKAPVTAEAFWETAPYIFTANGHETAGMSKEMFEALTNNLLANLKDLEDNDASVQDLKARENNLDAQMRSLEVDRKAIERCQKELKESRKKIKTYMKALKMNRHAAEADRRSEAMELRLSRLVFVNIAVTCAVIPVSIMLAYCFHKSWK